MGMSMRLIDSCMRLSAKAGRYDTLLLRSAFEQYAFFPLKFIFLMLYPIYAYIDFYF